MRSELAKKFAVILCSVLVGCGDGNEVHQDPPPNVILIVTDDLGYGDLGCYGNSAVPTPHLDALARSGVRFTSAYASHAYCSPSRAGILTGRYQQRFGHECNPAFDPESETLGLPVTEITIAQSLGKNGYVSAAIGKWHLGAHPRFHPLERGFQRFFGFLHGSHNYWGAEIKVTRGNKSGEPSRLLDDYDAVPESELSYLTDELTERTIEFIRQNQDRPFFVYLPHYAVHHPLQVPERYLERVAPDGNKSRRRLGAMVAALDESMGRLMDALEEMSLVQDTLVIFTSDNGGHQDCDNGPLRGKKGSYYEGGIRVPMIMSWPGRIPSEAEFDPMVSLLDLFPTILSATGSRRESGPALDGVDLLPYLDAPQKGLPHQTLFWRGGGGARRAIRIGDFKLVTRRHPAPEKVELYDLGKDLGEEQDLAPQMPELVDKMLREFEDWNAELVPPLWKDAGS